MLSAFCSITLTSLPSFFSAVSRTRASAFASVSTTSAVTIASFSATDNVDGEVDVYVYLVEPSGVMKKVSFGEKVKLSKAGVYQIRYLSIDAFGNLNILYYDITVA